MSEELDDDGGTPEPASAAPPGWDKKVSPERYAQLQAALAKGREKRAQMKRDREAARAAGLPDPYRRPPPAAPMSAASVPEPPEDPQMAARRRTQQQPQVEIPTDDGPNPAKVQELMTMYQGVNLEIKRRSFDKKWWGIVDSDIVVATSELVNLRPRIIGLAGGGLFMVNVRDPQNLAAVVYSFMLHIEGAPRVASSEQPQQQFGLPAGSAPATLPTTQDPSMGYPPYPYPPYGMPMQFDQWGRPVMHRPPQPMPAPAYYPPPPMPMYGPPSMPSADPSVTLLMRENADLKADVAKKDEKLSSLEDKFETRFKQMQDDAARAREEAREERYRADMRALEAKLDGGGRRGGGFMSGFEAFAPVLASVLPAVITSRGEASRAESDRAIQLQKMSTDQQMNLLTMLLSNAKGEDKELLKYLMDTVRSKADERVAGTESQIMMLKALGDFIQTQAGPDEPWWLPMVKEIVGTMQAGIATATLSRANASTPQLPGTAPQGLPGAAPAPQQQQSAAQPAQGQPQAQGQGAPMTVEQQRALAQWENFKRTDEQAARLTFEAYQSPAMIPELDTWEWRALIFNLHLRMDPKVLAEIVADHLEHLRTFNLLPQAFISIFQQPKNVLTIVLKLMPISREDPKYTDTVLDEIVDEIEFREKERKLVEADDAKDAAEAAGKHGGTNGSPAAGAPS